MLDLENSNRLYYSIKEVALHFNVKESLLRFWEKEFSEINPRKSAGGARQYSRKDIETIGVIYSLVKEKGMTLEGARQTIRVKKDEETRRVDLIYRLEKIRQELNTLKDSFDEL